MRRDILDVFKSQNFKQLNLIQTMHILVNESHKSKEDVKNALVELEERGEIIKNRKGGYVSIEEMGFKKGRIIGHQRGFAFCVVKREEDYFVPPRYLKNALDGDIVLIKPTLVTEQSTECQVVKVLKEQNKTVVGTYFVKGNGGYVEPDNSRVSKILFIKKKDNLDAKNGEKVVAKVNFQGQKGDLIGEIIEILGKNDSITTLELGIIREHKLYEEFPKEVISESEKISSVVSEKDIVGRRDLRKEIIFTIDGEDARDFDDAVSIEKLKNGNYLLGVHIADVTHYVKSGTQIDNEAFARATSVYFPNMVLPMLPVSLSNGICSLNEKCDRLTLTVEMEIDKNGETVKSDIYESVINSVKRLTYTEVYAVLRGEKEATERLKNLKGKFFMMQELSHILEQKRDRCGAIELDLPETYFVLDDNLMIQEVRKRERNEAHKLIESFMIACNETVAKRFCLEKIPFVYRVHEKPPVEKVKDVKVFMEGLQLKVPEVPSKITPFYYQDLTNLVENNDEIRSTVNKVILRSMQKAKYLENCVGHFGLGLMYYCHFTSPIRRYPDLTIHRIIKECLKGKLSPKKKDSYEDFVIDASLQSSEMERNADEAERDVDDLLKAVYMTKHIGEEFEGVISGVTNYGFYVELENSIEGLVKIESLPKDTYLFMEKSLKLTGKNHNFTLGQKVKIKCVASNIYERKIDFEIV